MNIAAPKRAYRQSARALAAQATADRILDVFSARLRDQWFDEIRLDDVARDAGVTIQTVLRRFGSKEGLLDATHRLLGEEIRQRRQVGPGDAVAAISGLVEDYEQVGDTVLRSLAQEDRYPAMKAVTDIGRAMHRQWIADAFAPLLERLPEEERRRATDALVVAADIYVWKLLRRDMHRPISEYRAMVERLCAAALGVDPEELFTRKDGDTQS